MKVLERDPDMQWNGSSSCPRVSSFVWLDVLILLCITLLSGRIFVCWELQGLERWMDKMTFDGLLFVLCVTCFTCLVECYLAIISEAKLDIENICTYTVSKIWWVWWGFLIYSSHVKENHCRHCCTWLSVGMLHLQTPNSTIPSLGRSFFFGLLSVSFF